MQVIKNQEFLQLTAEQLAALLASDDLNVPSEQHIFHALMSWIRFEANRDKSIATLLALVKLPLLEPAVSAYVHTSYSLIIFYIWWETPGKKLSIFWYRYKIQDLN